MDKLLKFVLQNDIMDKTIDQYFENNEKPDRLPDNIVKKMKAQKKEKALECDINKFKNIGVARKLAFAKEKEKEEFKPKINNYSLSGDKNQSKSTDVFERLASKIKKMENTKNENIKNCKSEKPNIFNQEKIELFLNKRIFKRKM